MKGTGLSQNDEKVLLGWSPYLILLSVFILAMAIPTVIEIGTGKSSGLFLVALPFILGIFVGLAGAGTTSTVRVYSTKVEMRNYLLRVMIPASLISDIDCSNGIKVAVRNSQSYVPAAYGRSLFKALSGNRRAKRFAAEVSEYLALARQAGSYGEPSPADQVERSVRWRAVCGVIGVALLMVVFAAALRFWG